MLKRPSDASPKKSAGKDFTPASFKGIVKARDPRIAKKLEEIEQAAVEFFVPVFKKDVRKGMSCYIPGTGVMVCNDKSKIEITGLGAVNTMRLEQLYAKNPVKHIFTDQTIQKAVIRDLADDAVMDKIEKFLSQGKTSITLGGRNPTLKKMCIEACLQSPNPFILANLACYVYGAETREINQMRSISYNTEGSRALELLAGEFASVKKISYDNALSDLSAAVGKPTLDDVMGFGNGYSPYDVKSLRAPG